MTSTTSAWTGQPTTQTENDTAPPEHGMFTEPQPDGPAPALPWELSTFTRKSGSRTAGHDAERAARTVPKQFSASYREILDDLLPVVNLEADSVRAVMTKAMEGAGYLLPDARIDAAANVLGDSLLNAAVQLEMAERHLASLTERAEAATRAARPHDFVWSDTAEATLKSDLRMRLDSIDADRLLEEVTELALTAHRTGDEGMMWTLARSEWGRWYLEARGLDPVQLAKYNQTLDEHGLFDPSVVEAKNFIAGELQHLAGFIEVCRGTDRKVTPTYRDAIASWLATNVS